MSLSNLQKFILKEVYVIGIEKYPKGRLLSFYKDDEDHVGTVTRSLERLLERGLINIDGHKTQYKMFIEMIELTADGRKIAQEIIDSRQRLSFGN
jgi:hypothetical protein